MRTAFLLAVLVSLGLVRLALSQTWETEAAAIRNLHQRSIVRIHDASIKDGQGFIGSGFVIHRDGYVVTNFHVLDGSRAAYIRTGDDAIYQIDSVLASNRELDFMVLRIRGRDLTPLPLGTVRSLTAGDAVAAIGYPAGFPLTFTTGSIQDIVEFRGSILLRHSAVTSPGSSGGALFSSERVVVGITRGAFTLANGTPVAGSYQAVPIDLVRQALSKKGVTIPVASPRGLDTDTGGGCGTLCKTLIVAGASAATIYGVQQATKDSTNDGTNGDELPPLVAQFSSSALAACSFNSHQFELSRSEDLEITLTGGGLADLDLYMFIGRCSGNLGLVDASRRCTSTMQVTSLGACGVFQQSISTRASERITISVAAGAYTLMVINLAGPTSGYMLQVLRR